MGALILSALPFVIAFGISFFLTAIQVITKDFPYTSRFVLCSWAFWALCACYGVIGALGVSLLQCHLIVVNHVLDGDITSGIISGIFSKSIANLTIFTVHGNGGAFPIGLKSIVQTFEPWLERLCKCDEYNAVQRYIAPLVKKYSSKPDELIDKVLENIPSTFEESDKKAFRERLSEIRKQKTTPAAKIKESLNLFIRFAGIKNMDRTFTE